MGVIKSVHLESIRANSRPFVVNNFLLFSPHLGKGGIYNYIDSPDNSISPVGLSDPPSGSSVSIKS